MDAPLFLGYATAAYALLHRGLAGLRKSHALPTPGAAPTAKQVHEARELLGLPSDARLDTVVTCDRDKRKSARQRGHISGCAGEGDYLRLESGVYLARPELAFLQSAEMLSVPELVLLGLELCGAYVSGDGFFNRPRPVTTKELLSSYVEDHAGVRGARKSREALKFIANGSASPRESQLTTLLCISQKWGGYGLTLPSLNAKIELTSRQKGILGKTHLRCDLYWEEARLTIEYDSNAFHTRAAKINDDSLRRNILRSAGIAVIDVTNSQLKKAEALHEIALQVDLALESGLISQRNEKWLGRNITLRNLVLNESALDRLL